MANLKELKGRIVGIKKTRQITAAMKLVAGAKLKRATDRASARRIVPLAGEQAVEHEPTVLVRLRGPARVP